MRSKFITGFATIFGDKQSRLVGLKDPGLAAMQRWGEADSFACAHCGKHTFCPPRVDGASLGGLCRRCNKLICSRPECHRDCVPRQQRIDERLNAQRRVQDYLGGAEHDPS